MTRIVLAALSGAVIYYVWQMMAWMVLPIHGPTVSGLPNEDPVRDLLVEQNVETGVYIVPYGTEEAMADPESEFMKRHAAGPIFSVYFHKDGLAPMAPSVMVGGFLLDFLGAAIAAAMLSCAVGGCCCRSYVQRVGFVAALGVFLALMGHVAYYNWMHFPADYTAMFALDVIVGWLLAGLAIAAIIKPGPT